MVTDEDVAIIKLFIQDFVSKPSLTHDMDDFKTQSYMRYAAEEILSIVSEESLKPPPYVAEPGVRSRDVVEILEEFIFYSDLYNEMANGTSYYGFAIAQETAEELLYFYVHKKGELV